MALIRNVFAGIGCLVVVIGLAVAAVLWRDDIAAWWENRRGVIATEPSAELAEIAERKLVDVYEGRAAEARLSEMELQSYLEYRLAEGFPAGVRNPAVDLRDSTAMMSVDLNLAELAEASQAAASLRRFMGDSTRLNAELYPHLAGPGQGGVTIVSLQAGLVPVPPLMIPNILAQTGLATTGGRTVLFVVPPDVEEIGIRGEEIVLRRTAR